MQKNSFSVDLASRHSQWGQYTRPSGYAELICKSADYLEFYYLENLHGLHFSTTAFVV